MIFFILFYEIFLNVLKLLKYIRFGFCSSVFFVVFLIFRSGFSSFFRIGDIWFSFRFFGCFFFSLRVRNCVGEGFEWGLEGVSFQFVVQSFGFGQLFGFEMGDSLREFRGFVIGVEILEVLCELFCKDGSSGVFQLQFRYVLFWGRGCVLRFFGFFRNVFFWR